MPENKNDNEEHKELLKETCRFVERMVDKQIAAGAESLRDQYRLGETSRFRHRSKNALAGISLIAVGLLIGASGLFYQAYAENKDRYDETIRKANREKLEITSSISVALTSMRELSSIALIYCSAPMAEEKKQTINIERVKRRTDLESATRFKQHLFNDKFSTLIDEFLSWDKSISDYCDPRAPSDSQWDTKQQEIEDQMALAPVQNFV